MPRTETTVRELYQFDELDEKAKDRARDWLRELKAQDFDHEYIYEDAATICTILGITLSTHEVKLMSGQTRQKVNIWYSGFSSQGDGACFEGSYRYQAKSVRAIKAHAPTDTELHRIARELYELQRAHGYKLEASITHRGYYSHSHSTTVEVLRTDDREVHSEVQEAIAQLLRDLMDWIYDGLRKEYDWSLSDACIDEDIRGNEYEFTQSGARACAC